MTLKIDPQSKNFNIFSTQKKTFLNTVKNSHTEVFAVLTTVERAFMWYITQTMFLMYLEVAECG